MKGDIRGIYSLFPLSARRMSAHSSSTGRTLVASLFLALSIQLTGCFGTDEATWTEEVQLSDGRIIQVQRIARQKSSGFPNAPRGADVDNELSYAPLGIRWRANAPANLMSFDIVGGVAYMAVYHAPEGFCEEHGSSRYKALFYRWDQNKWNEIEQPDYPTEIALVNLYRRYWGHDDSLDAKGLVTWQTKALRDGFNPGAPETIQAWYVKYGRICKPKLSLSDMSLSGDSR